MRAALLTVIVTGAVALGGAATAFPPEARLAWHMVSGAILTSALADTPQVVVTPEAESLIRAAEGQVGVTTVYDPAYVGLAFPGGDVPADRGICTDVLVRALRVAHGVDLQAAVKADMKANFAKYPAHWGLSRTDRNIAQPPKPAVCRGHPPSAPAGATEARIAAFDGRARRPYPCGHDRPAPRRLCHWTNSDRPGHFDGRAGHHRLARR